MLGVAAFWQINPASSVWRGESSSVSLKVAKPCEAEDKEMKDEQCGYVFCSWLLFEVLFLVVLL